MSLRLMSATTTVVALLVFASIGVTQAQTTDPVPLDDGDIAWAFAQEEPLFDGRVAGALGTAMEPRVLAADTGTRIVRVELSGPDLQVAPIYPAADVPLLLQAAGFGDTPPFVEVGQCLIWTASGGAEAAVSVLTEALQGALGSLGVTTQACAETSDPAEAHLLVWVHGEDTAPSFAIRQTPTFLSGPGTSVTTPLPGGGTGTESVPSSPGGAGGSPLPAVTGNAGIEGPAGHRAAALVGALLMAAVLTGGRLARRRRYE